MANHNITIEGIDSEGHLILSDRGLGYTAGQKTDTITWIIGPQSGVASITDIQDNSSIDVFNPNPRPFPQDPPTRADSNWRGTIRSDLTLPNPPNYVEESYSILFRRTPGGEVERHDPIIRVNP